MIEGHRTVRHDGGEPSALACLVRVRFQQRPELLAFDLREARQEMLNRAEFGDELLRRLLADALDARNVVRLVAHQSHDLDNPGRLDPEAIPGVLLGEHLVLHRIEDADRRGKKLEHVLVAGHNDHVQPFRRGLLGKCPDQVVRLEALEFHDRDRKGFHHPMDVGNLLRQGAGHRGAVGLVFFEFFVAEGRALLVEHHGQVSGPPLSDDLLQHRDEAIDGIRRKAGGGR